MARPRRGVPACDLRALLTASDRTPPSPGGCAVRKRSFACRGLKSPSAARRRDSTGDQSSGGGVTSKAKPRARRGGPVARRQGVAVHGLRAIGRVHVDRLPRMADFALWATACETSLWPAGTVARAYAANRRAAIESIIEADPVAMCVRALMIDRTVWRGSASELLSLCAERARAGVSGTSWTKNPRALAGRLRRAQTFLRTLGIEITFSREGHTGTRMIRVSTSAENSVSTVSIVSAARSTGSRGDQAILPGVGE